MPTNIFDMSDLWNNVSTTFNAIKMNVNNAASAATSRLLDLQTDGVSRFNVAPDGIATGATPPALDNSKKLATTEWINVNVGIGPFLPVNNPAATGKLTVATPSGNVALIQGSLAGQQGVTWGVDPISADTHVNLHIVPKGSAGVNMYSNNSLQVSVNGPANTNDYLVITGSTNMDDPLVAAAQGGSIRLDQSILVGPSGGNFAGLFGSAGGGQAVSLRADNVGNPDVDVNIHVIPKGAGSTQFYSNGFPQALVNGPANTARYVSLMGATAGGNPVIQAAFGPAIDIVNANLAGVPTATTAAPGTNTTQVATTAFVGAAVATGGGGFQPLDADLTSIAAASGIGVMYYRSAANTWAPVAIGANLTFTGGTLAATGGGGGVTDAEYITSAVHAGLSAERVLTNTPSVTWDFATPGQAKANAAGFGNVFNAGVPTINQFARWISANQIEGINPVSVNALIGAAPSTAEYITSAANAGLSAERVLTDTASVAWDFTTPGQAKANAVGGGGGNVSNSGTPTVGQYGKWVTATTIQGVAPATVLSDIGAYSLQGGTLGGNILISAPSPSVTLAKPSAATDAKLISTVVGVPRWEVNLATDTASDFAINRYNDAGAFVDSPISISRVSGGITLAVPQPNITMQKQAGANGNIILGTTASAPRWRMMLGNGAAESGSNVGSDFSIDRYNDAGTFVDTPLVINRATGAVSINGASGPFVAKTGDTMTGDLNVIPSGSVNGVRLSGVAAQARLLAVGADPDVGVFMSSRGNGGWFIYTNDFTKPQIQVEASPGDTWLKFGSSFFEANIKALSDLPVNILNAKLTGAPTAITPAVGDNSTRVATTAFVRAGDVSGATPPVGTVGEVLTLDFANVALTTATNVTVGSLLITAGEWELYGGAHFIGSAAVFTTMVASVTTGSVVLTIATDPYTTSKYVGPAMQEFGFRLGPKRASLAGSATFNLVVNATFSATGSCSGYIRARRMK